MTREIVDFFKVNDVKYRENLKLSSISPVRIGGNAQFVAYPDSVERLIKAVDFLRNKKIRYKLLGRMSNVLPPDEDYAGVIVRTDNISPLLIKGTDVEIGAGVSLPQLAKITADEGLSGLEELSGIPGSIGGAIRGNAGAFGREIGELVSFVNVYNCRLGVTERLKADRIGFDYRKSGLMSKDLVILSARLALSRSDSVTSNDLIKKYREKRMATQPVGQASLGSVFKRVTKDISASKLVDECGLKGFSIGGAKISEKHAGFIINCGNASAKDYLSLAEYAAESVYKRFHIKLEREVEIF